MTILSLLKKFSKIAKLYLIVKFVFFRFYDSDNLYVAFRDALLQNFLFCHSDNYRLFGHDSDANPISYNLVINYPPIAVKSKIITRTYVCIF